MRRCVKRRIITGAFIALAALLLLGAGAFFVYRATRWQGLEAAVLESPDGALPAELTFENHGSGIRIVRFRGLFYDGELAVPSQINGSPVTVIAPGAFSDVAGLTRLRLPPTIRTIGAEAFARTPDLSEVVLPASATPVLGEKLFSNSPGVLVREGR